MWDITTPQGTESATNGDNRIRELKTDIAAALTAEGSFPGADTANPKFRWTPPQGNTAGRPASPVTGQLYLNTETGAMERYSGSAWEGKLPIIPSGTPMVFYKATAPIGWTAVAVNDKFLRVVTAGGTGGTTGGTVAASTNLAHSHTVNSHTHTGPSHTHTTPSHTHDLEHTNTTTIDVAVTASVKSNASSGSDMGTASSGGSTTIWQLKNRTETSGSGTSGAGGTGDTGSASPGTDSQLGAFAYADIIVCSKD